MSQVIILGDVHLGKSASIGKVGLGSSLNSRVTDQLNLLDWTLDRAIESNVDHIIITGDIFEEPKPAPILITLFISWLKKCQAHDVHVHLIIGNHDILRTGNIYTSPLDIIGEVELETVHIYKNVNTIFIDTTAFTLLPFRDRKSFNVSSNAQALKLLQESLIYELASIPSTYKKILIGHLALEGSIPVGDEIDDLTNELFCPINMFVGYDYVWMGHVHKPQIMNKNPYVAHIGSMDISNFGEADQKKYIIIIDCLTNDGFSTQEIPTRPLKKINIIVPKDCKHTTQYVLDKLEEIKDGLERAIVKIDIILSAPELEPINKNAVEKLLSSKNVFNVVNISETKKIAILKKDNNIIDSKMDVPLAIKTYADLHVDPLLKSNFLEIAMNIYNEYKNEAK